MRNEPTVRVKCQREYSLYLPGQAVQALPAPRLPHPQRPIILHTDQEPPIWTECERIDHARVAAQRPQAVASFASPVELPQSHGTIVAATGQQSRGTASQRPDPAAASLQSAHALPPSST